MKKLFDAINKFAKIVNLMSNKPPQYTSTIKDDVEYRDRFHGAVGEERQKLLEAEVKSKGYTLVPDKITPVSESQVIQAVRNIVDKKYPQMDDDAKQELVFTIVPQIRLETGFKPHNFNMGNAHARGTPNEFWKGLVSAWKDPQDFDGKKVINLDWLWRSYSTLEEGIGDWFRLFEKNFPTALAKAVAGDIEGFSRELKAKGYYTANVETYTKGLKRIKEKMRNKYYRDSHQAIK